MRDHNREFRDNSERKYQYDFDAVLREFLLKRVDRFIIRDGMVLEMGSYLGDMTEQILTRVEEVTVIEASSELATGVAGRFGSRVSVVNATFEEVDLEPTFDTIFLVHTLEHLDDPVSVLRRARSWLRPNGSLIVAVPNANALSRQIAVRMGLISHNSAVTPGEWKHGHRRTYSLDVLISHVLQADLSVVDSGGVIVKPFANFQWDRALDAGIVDSEYVEACDDLALVYPDLSASIFVVAGV